MHLFITSAAFCSGPFDRNFPIKKYNSETNKFVLDIESNFMEISTHRTDSVHTTPNILLALSLFPNNFGINAANLHTW